MTKRDFIALDVVWQKNMITTGIPITTISQVLGHINIETTKIYLSLDSENLKECSLNFENIHLERGELL